MLKVNGILTDGISGKTIAEYLAMTDYDPKLIAVEKNDEIVPRVQYAKTVIEDNDVIEIVSFVGGG